MCVGERTAFEQDNRQAGLLQRSQQDQQIALSHQLNGPGLHEARHQRFSDRWRKLLPIG